MAPGKEYDLTFLSAAGFDPMMDLVIDSPMTATVDGDSTASFSYHRFDFDHSLPLGWWSEELSWQLPFLVLLLAVSYFYPSFGLRLRMVDE